MIGPSCAGRNAPSVLIATTALVSVGIVGTASAQCTNTVTNPAQSATLNAVGGGVASTANSILSVVNTMDTAFLAQGTAFVTSPPSSTPDQPGGGVWAREVFGRATTESTGTTNGAVVSGATVPNAITCNSSVRQEFGGVQVGADVARLNVGGSGAQLFFGLTGGVGRAVASDNTSTFSGTFTVPFVGAYGALVYGDFLADLMVRDNFYSMEISNPSISLHDQSLNASGPSISGNVIYHFQIPNSAWSIEPSIGFVHSEVRVDPLSIRGNLTASETTLSGGETPPGTLSFEDIKSTLGRAGVRVGTSLTAGNLALAPFLTASVWHEFEPSSAATFTSDPSFSTNFQQMTSRIGTYGQYSAGVSGELIGTGWAGYARVDFRDGKNIESVSVNGGLRYSFDPRQFGAGAMGADISKTAPLYKAPPAPAAATFTWTGCYLGAQGGAGWGRSDNNVTLKSSQTTFPFGPSSGLADETPADFSSRPRGELFGGQLGCNYQFGTWVIGIEGEGWSSNMKQTTLNFGTEDPTPDPHRLEASNLWDAALSARFGIAIDRAFLYGKLGLAYGEFQYAFTDATDNHDFNVGTTQVGGIFGAGAEYSITQNWSARIEYDWVNYGTNTVNTHLTIPGNFLSGTITPYSFSVKETTSIIKAGVNFKFGT
jgi:opacity protein-like surface antigen